MEAPPPVPQTLPEEPQAPSTSLMGRLFNVFATPGEVFDEVKAALPTATNWLVPALILMFVGWIGSALVLSQPAIQQQLSEIVEKGVRAQLEKAHMPKEKLEQVLPVAEKWAGIMTYVSSFAGPPVAAFLTPFGWGLIVWLIGSKIHKGNFGYLKAVEVVGLGSMISVLDAVVKTLLIITMSNLFAAPGLTLLVKDFNPQNPSHALLAMANVMTIWVLAVRSIGLARLARISLAKAMAWIFGIWLAYSGLFIAMSAFGQMMAGRGAGS